MSELDGEVGGFEVISTPTNTVTEVTDDFYSMDGEVIPMVAASAAVDTGNYFDQDNFYPADGLVINPDAVNYEQEGSLSDAEFSNGVGDFFRETAESIKKRSAERREARKARRAAKTAEIQSRAEVNKSLTQDKPSDLALAEALKESSKQPVAGTGGKSSTMSKSTKTLLIVGGVLVVGGLATWLLLRKKK